MGNNIYQTFEFQSSYVDVNDKRRFRFYSALFDHVEIKSEKPIEVHVLSSVETEKVKWYNINPDSRFPIYIHSLKDYDGDKFLNMMNAKIEDEEMLNEKELLMLSLLCFMDTEKDIPHAILDSATTITNIPNLNKNIGQFVKGIVLMLCDKFVEDELMNTRIANRVGGNMKIVEDYADRVAEQKLTEKNEALVVKLRKKGFKFKEIAETAEVSLDFVEKVLSKVKS
jgi:predicted transcriptional regulator